MLSRRTSAYYRQPVSHARLHAYGMMPLRVAFGDSYGRHQMASPALLIESRGRLLAQRKGRFCGAIADNSVSCRMLIVRRNLPACLTGLFLFPVAADSGRCTCHIAAIDALPRPLLSPSATRHRTRASATCLHRMPSAYACPVSARR